MALSRQDRALMRQRGAGSRIIRSNDFGLNFGFANERQERQQMRQRGAASRTIDNVDFGFSFPTPNRRSLRSSSKTPQSQASVTRQRPRTPARRSREPSTARSARQSSIGPTEHDTNPAQTEDAVSHDTGQSAKRRRLSESLTTPAQILVQTPKSTSTLRRSQRRKSGQMFTTAEDEDAVVPNDSDQVAVTSLDQRQESPLFVPEASPTKENDVPNDLFSGDMPPDPGLGAAETDSPNRQPGSVVEIESLAQKNSPIQQERQSSLVSNSSHAVDTSKQKRKKKRKSVTFPRKKARSSEQPASSSMRTESPVLVDAPQATSPLPSSPGSVPLARRISKFSRLQSRARRTEPDAASFREPSPKEAEEDGDETYIQEESSPEPETPAMNKKTDKKVRRQTARETSSEAPKIRQPKSTFPILTHRLAAMATLPTIPEAEDSAEEAEVDQNVPKEAVAERTQPNAVDILAQICRETISSLMERMSENIQSSERSTVKNKRSALEAFGEDLNDELFEMSEAVENRINLEARVRRSKREKAGLQAEWIELRREREQIALKCDAVRRRHWESENEAREKWALSEAAKRVEHEIERDSAEEDEGLEFFLRNVTDIVSCQSSRGGILGMIKSFNSQLEHMATFLEG